MSIEIIYKGLDELHPYDNNPRCNDDAVEAVKNSIAEFGFLVPIVIDGQGVIASGDTRYKAAQELQLDQVPCIMADDLTGEQIKAYRLADNKVSEIATWDMEALCCEIGEIVDIDMSQFGFEKTPDLNIDDFFTDKKALSEKEAKSVVCPHCGEVFIP